MAEFPTAIWSGGKRNRSSITVKFQIRIPNYGTTANNINDPSSAMAQIGDSPPSGRGAGCMDVDPDVTGGLPAGPVFSEAVFAFPLHPLVEQHAFSFQHPR